MKQILPGRMVFFLSLIASLFMLTMWALNYYQVNLVWIGVLWEFLALPVLLMALMMVVIALISLARKVNPKSLYLYSIIMIIGAAMVLMLGS